MDGLEKELLDESLVDASKELSYDWWDGNSHHVVLGTKGSIASVANAMMERERLTEEVERLRSEVADAINNMYFAEGVANSAIERRGKAEAEVERLRKLCADRPRIEFYGESSFSPSIPSAADISEWNAKIDAEGRRAAGRGEEPNNV